MEMHSYNDGVPLYNINILSENRCRNLLSLPNFIQRNVQTLVRINEMEMELCFKPSCWSNEALLTLEYQECLSGFTTVIFFYRILECVLRKRAGWIIGEEIMTSFLISWQFITALNKDYGSSFNNKVLDSSLHISRLTINHHCESFNKIASTHHCCNNTTIQSECISYLRLISYCLVIRVCLLAISIFIQMYATPVQLPCNVMPIGKSCPFINPCPLSNS